jgi:hypothetical protein
MGWGQEGKGWFGGSNHRNARDGSEDAKASSMDSEKMQRNGRIMGELDWWGQILGAANSARGRGRGAEAALGNGVEAALRILSLEWMWKRRGQLGQAS